MSKIVIPPEALEAAARHCPYSQYFEVAAAIEAALKAWPGMHKGDAWNPHTGDLRWSRSIMLPLPQETSDDKA